ncbi:HD domain-containing phosphohydrolase [uncultured Sphaerochaeta sp.]|uniref:HD domain-containing phosphohydrolase n=1 Tax=uncultured Sphaerochaeta sp. TaxID=886478 RepID=UPI002A0A3849|nr:HD domain-containing phosphohydrolase [uncultured Sphaerochaeta sp.]
MGFLHSFTVYHALIEFAIIFVSVSMYDMGTKTPEYFQNRTIHTISIYFCGIALMEAMHTLAFIEASNGQAGFQNRSLQLMVAANILRVLLLCSIPIIQHTHISTKRMWLAVIGFYILVFVSILAGIFPDCYTEEAGTTLFFSLSQYAVAAITLPALFTVKNIFRHLKDQPKSFIAFTPILILFSSLSYALSKNSMDNLFIFGDLFKFIAYGVLWTLILDEGYLKSYKKKFQQAYDNSLRDQLTGLYNRRYFEQNFAKLVKKQTQRQVSLAMFDINGLKLINDAFGHLEGDKLISSFASTLKSKCQDDLTHAIRLGGDEFLMIFYDNSSNQVRGTVDEIISTFSKMNEGKIPYSTSYGFSFSDDDTDWALEDLFIKAEEDMYRFKLQYSPVIKAKIIEQTIQTVYTTTSWEESHSRNVAQLCEEMAKELHFSKTHREQMFEAGRLHDIGKINIDKSILEAPRPLTSNEVIKLRHHCETGYVILSSVNKYAQIADYILYHHERFDGKGYPLGLSGDKIPVESRILAIADAFDEMTSKRPYRMQAFTREDAANELLKSSNSQFDYSLVLTFIEQVLKLEVASIMS